MIAAPSITMITLPFLLPEINLWQSFCWDLLLHLVPLISVPLSFFYEEGKEWKYSFYQNLEVIPESWAFIIVKYGSNDR